MFLKSGFDDGLCHECRGVDGELADYLEAIVRGVREVAVGRWVVEGARAEGAGSFFAAMARVGSA